MCLYQWGCFESNTLYNWTGAGALGYLVLFQASTYFTEWISAGKYPEYKDYKQLVGQFVPSLRTEKVADRLEKRKKTQ